MAKFNLSFKEYLALPESVSETNCMPDGIPELIHECCDYGDDNDQTVQLWELGQQVEFYGRWMQAKSRGYEILCKHGVDALIDQASSISIENGQVEGKWLLVPPENGHEGVVYVFYNGKVDTALANGKGDKKNRTVARYLLGEMNLNRGYNVVEVAA